MWQADRKGLKPIELATKKEKKIKTSASVKLTQTRHSHSK